MVQKFEIFDSIEARKFNLSEDNQKLFRFLTKIEKIFIFLIFMPNFKHEMKFRDKLLKKSQRLVFYF